MSYNMKILCLKTLSSAEAYSVNKHCQLVGVLNRNLHQRSLVSRNIWKCTPLMTCFYRVMLSTITM